MSHNQIRRVMGFTILVSVLVFSVYYFYHYLEPDAKATIHDISNNWTYGIGADAPVHPLPYFSTVNEVNPNQVLRLERVITETCPHPTLLVKNYNQSMRLFLDGEPLLSTHGDELPSSPGSGLHFVPLPPDYAGRTLTLELVSPYSSYAGVLRPIYLGDIRSLQAKVVSEGIPHLFFLFACTVGGFFFMLYSLYAQHRSGSHWDSFFFGLFSVLLGLYMVVRDDIFYLFFTPEMAPKAGMGLHIVYLIPLMAYLYFFFTKHQRIVLCIIVFFCAEATVFYLLQLLHIRDWAAMINYINIGVSVPFIPIAVIVVYEFIHKNRFIRFLSPIILLVIVFSIATVVDYGTAQRLATAFYLLSAFLLVAIIWSFHFMEFVRLRINERNEMKTLQIRNEFTLKGYEEMSKHIEQVRALRHEMSHHISALKTLCATRALPAVCEYLSAISLQLEQTTIIYSENCLVDSIVTSGINRAKGLGIRVSYSIDVPSKLPIPDIDMCSLLSNMIDNAVEANMRQEAGADRWIDLQLRKKGDYLVISCDNSSPGISTTETSKPEKQEHGYGLKVMRAIVEKHGSILNVSYGPEQFSVKTILSLS